MFEEQCKKTPDKTAVVYKEKKFTYAEIDEITDRIAGYVHSKGIGKEEVVSILIPRMRIYADCVNRCAEIGRGISTA